MNEQPMEIEQRALEYGRRFSGQVEVMAVESSFTPVSFEAEKLKQVETGESWGLGVRIVVDGRIGSSSTNDPGDIEGAVDRAVELAKYGPEARFELPGAAEYPDVSVEDPAIDEIGAERLIEAGRELLAAAKQLEPEAMFDAEFSVGRTRTSIANSAGASASYSQTTFDSSISGTLVRGTDMLFVGEWKSGCSPDWDVEKLLERTRRQLEWSRETADAPEGRLPVLFMPRAVGNVLLGPFFSGINGRSVVQGSSPLGGRVGETIFDPRLTIVDAPTTPMKPRSRPWDDEGVPSRDQPLVDRGVLKTILYDLQTAGQGGTETTGSASRDLGEMPRPSTSYLRIEPGDRNFDELVAEMGEGVIVEEMIGMGQGNVLGGDAGGNILLGYAVHGGEIVGRIKDTMLHCNIYEVLKQVRGIGSEVDELGGRLASPAIVCDGVSISPAGDS